jgi:hypothetical protein
MQDDEFKRISFRYAFRLFLSKICLLLIVTYIVFKNLHLDLNSLEAKNILIAYLIGLGIIDLWLYCYELGKQHAYYTPKSEDK